MGAIHKWDERVNNNKTELDVVVYVYNPSNWGLEARGLQSQHELYSDTLSQKPSKSNNKIPHKPPEYFLFRLWTCPSLPASHSPVLHHVKPLPLWRTLLRLPPPPVCVAGGKGSWGPEEHLSSLKVPQSKFGSVFSGENSVHQKFRSSRVPSVSPCWHCGGFCGPCPGSLSHGGVCHFLVFFIPGSCTWAQGASRRHNPDRKSGRSKLRMARD